jgi:SOUL heme-binding protein
MLDHVGQRVGAAAASGLSLVGIRTWEQPPYTVLERLEGGTQIRRYADRVTAQTEVEGEDREARGRAFQALEAYLAQEEIAMTAPVESVGAGGRLRVGFFLPSRWTVWTAPEPADPCVEIALRPGEILAALRFAGLVEPEAVARHARDLLASLGGSRWSAEGGVAVYTYDPPWAIPILRRNEVVVAVTPSGWPSRA